MLYINPLSQTNEGGDQLACLNLIGNITAGFPQALEIMENLENHEKKFYAWKKHRI